MTTKSRFILKLTELGFTGPFEFFYWANDGWYVHCAQMAHIWLGQNRYHVMERLEKQGNQYVSQYLKNE